MATLSDHLLYALSEGGIIMVRFPRLFGLIVVAIPIAAAQSETVPDALSVEWQGQKPCERLFEDAHILVARCVFPPGAVHARHSHPGYSSYVLSGGRAQIQDEKGTRQVELRTGALLNSPPVPWHELTNTGDATLGFLVIERKYEPVPGDVSVEQTAGK